MNRLTPENPKVVWESEPVTRSRAGNSFFGHGADTEIRLDDGTLIADAYLFPPGWRIRITAEVIEPEKGAANP